MKYSQALFFDVDKNEVFVVTREQWEEAKDAYSEKQYRDLLTIQRGEKFMTKDLGMVIITGNEIHKNWIYKEDQDYSDCVKNITNDN